MRVNQRRWEEVVAVHANAPSADLEGFRRGGLSLNAIEQTELGEVGGKGLLHLQCDFGLDTLSWGRLGADVTDVDCSKSAFSLARKLSKELDIPARFIQSDLYSLPRVLGGTFDIVFVS